MLAATLLIIATDNLLYLYLEMYVTTGRLHIENAIPSPKINTLPTYSKTKCFFKA